MALNGKQRRYPKLVFGETLSVAIETFRVSKVRFILTSLGMVIGTASLILVVTIGLTGKQYLLQQIQNIGSNMMVAEYSGGGIYDRDASSDFLTLDDLSAVRERVPGISNSSPMIEYHDHVVVPGGKERDIMVLGVGWGYLFVRNLQVLAGRFFDDSDIQARNKVGVITQKLAITMYGSEDAAIGKEIKLTGLPFTVIGVFRERVDTFRPDRDLRRHHPDSLHGGTLLHQHRRGEAVVLLGVGLERSAARHAGDTRCIAVAPSAGVGVSRG